MVRNAFNFGTMVQGFDANVFLAPVAPATRRRPPPDIRTSSTTISTSSCRRTWESGSRTRTRRTSPTMGHVDTILNYAQSHNMNVRMHNLIWGNQQPTWVNTLITNAQSSNPTIAGPAKANLMNAIANRIAYYVGDGDADMNDGDRAQKYLEIDVLNEALREGHVLGHLRRPRRRRNLQDGAGRRRGGRRRHAALHQRIQHLSIRQRSQRRRRRPVCQLVSPQHVEEDQQRRFRPGRHRHWHPVDREPREPISSNAHSPARINQVLQNLSVTGLPITLTEFSVRPSPTGFTRHPDRAMRRRFTTNRCGCCLARRRRRRS